MPGPRWVGVLRQSGYDEQVLIGLWTSPMSFRLRVETEPE